MTEVWKDVKIRTEVQQMISQVDNSLLLETLRHGIRVSIESSENDARI